MIVYKVSAPKSCPKESLISSVFDETGNKSEAVIEGSELTQEEENQMPLTILVSNAVQEKENVLFEDKPKVQPLNSEQTSELKSISEEESIVTSSQVVSEASVDELAKSSEK